MDLSVSIPAVKVCDLLGISVERLAARQRGAAKLKDKEAMFQEQFLTARNEVEELQQVSR
jgi:hypothetical protein